MLLTNYLYEFNSGLVEGGTFLRFSLKIMDSSKLENDLISDYHSLEVDKALTQMQSTIWKNEFVGWKDEGDPMRFSSPASELLN